MIVATHLVAHSNRRGVDFSARGGNTIYLLLHAPTLCGLNCRNTNFISNAVAGVSRKISQYQKNLARTAISIFPAVAALYLGKS